MKIYESSKTGNEKLLEDGAVGYRFKIESVTLVQQKSSKRHDLYLILKDNLRNYSFEYKLFGKIIRDKFMSNLNASNIEELVGKNIIGFMDIDGLAVNKLCTL